MPIYDYICKKCGYEFEQIVTDSKKVVECPGCTHRDLDKQLSTSNFKFVGDGFYVNDYKGEK